MRQLGDRSVFSVDEVNNLAKELLEQVSIWVEGEVYDFKSTSSRYYYVYFQLKDDSGNMILPSIMTPEVFRRLDFNFENGQNVLAHGKLTLFTKTGKFQFRVDRMELAGEGQLARELERLKAKLQQEGLFDQGRKRQLPPLAENIGVITSATSDAWADFQRHSVAKFPLMRLFLADVFVQGPKSVHSILRAIAHMQSQPIDVLVITRGGGSLDDLSAFNDERVARAIAASKIPTIVGVGHEKDISIADLVADVRASTPTNAGQILTAPYEEALSRLSFYRSQMSRYAESTLDGQRQQLDQQMRHLTRTRDKYQALPYRLNTLGTSLRHQYHRLADNKSLTLALLQEKLQLSARACTQRATQRLDSSRRQLEVVSPMAVLARGYSMVEVNGSIVRSSRQVKQGDTMHIRLHQGGIRGLITRVEDE